MAVFDWANTFIVNLEIAISGTYHHFNFKKCDPCYLTEAQYRINLRLGLGSLANRLLWTGVKTAPCCEKWLRLGIVRAS